MPRSFINTVRNYRSENVQGEQVHQTQFNFNSMVTRSGRSFNTVPTTSRSFSGSACPSRSTSRHRRSTEFAPPRLHCCATPPSWGYLPIMTRYDLILRDTKIDFFLDPLLTKTIQDHDFDSANDFLARGDHFRKPQLTLTCSLFLKGDFGKMTSTYRKFKVYFPKPVKRLKLKARPANVVKSSAPTPHSEIRFKLKLVATSPRKVISVINPAMNKSILNTGLKQLTANPPKQDDEHTIVKTGTKRQVLVLHAKPVTTHQSPSPIQSPTKIVIPFPHRPDQLVLPSDHTIQQEPRREGAFTCVQCDRMFVNYAAARSHALAHSLRQNRCQLCGKVFSRNWLLQGHMRTHTGVKPFHCPECSKSFADKSNLRSHMLTHTAIKGEFVCEICNRAFAQKRYLNKHQQDVCYRQYVEIAK